jgi:hypothetical protein
MFYIETEGPKGFPRPTAELLEKLARTLVPILSGGKFQLTRWETGPMPRTPEPGWIMIDTRAPAATRTSTSTPEPVPARSPSTNVSLIAITPDRSIGDVVDHQDVGSVLRRDEIDSRITIAA